MKAIEIVEHFLSRADWVDPNQTVDRVIAGDPEKEVRTVLVTWISSLDAVCDAIARGFDMLMTHEPTFYDHLDKEEAREQSEVAREKKQLIEENGLVVVRNHDVWDRFPEVGVPWAWARFLEMGDKPVETGWAGYQHRYDIEPISLEQLAKRIARKTATIGEAGVQMIGDGNQMVSRIGVGTGCCCSTDCFESMGCDVSIVCDDGSCYWANLQRAADQRHPVIRVNHNTSEEPAMITLTDYINANLPGVRAEYRPHSCFRLVTP